MTYKSRFEQLLLISIQKSNAFLEIVRMEGRSGSSRYLSAQATWEAAEREYVFFLELMESGLISPNDRFSPIRTAFKAYIKSIAAAFFEWLDRTKSKVWNSNNAAQRFAVAL